MTLESGYSNYSGRSGGFSGTPRASLSCSSLIPNLLAAAAKSRLGFGPKASLICSLVTPNFAAAASKFGLGRCSPSTASGGY